MLFPFLTYISTETASNVSSVEFTSGIDTTYSAYQFIVSLDRVTTDTVKLGFDMSINGGSSYAAFKTTTLFRAYHTPGGAVSLAKYDSSRISGTGVQYLMGNLGNDNSTECGRCILTIVDPSSATFETGFHSIGTLLTVHPRAETWWMGGVSSVSTAVNAVKFVISSGNWYGNVKLYGVGESA